MIAIDNSFSLGTISQLIELGCDVNAKDVDGNTALTSSMYIDNQPAFEILLSQGARVDIEDNDGQTVKSLCIEDNLTKFIALLKKREEGEQLATSELLASKG